MKRNLSKLIPTAGIALFALSSTVATANDVRICTSHGIVEIELETSRAPLHARNFLNYVDSGFYNGTVFHRTVENSMVQGGAYTPDFSRRQPGVGIASEADNGLSNRRGTVAASRSEDPDSATSQFFFNLGDNLHLDSAPGAPGYTVFGRVTAGIEVLDRIGALPTRSVGELVQVPLPAVELESVVRIDQRPVFGLSIAGDAAQLHTNLDQAIREGNARGVLAAATALRRDCESLTRSEALAEAEALAELGETERSRYALANLLASSNSLDPLLPRIQALMNGIPRSEPASRINELAAHCLRPQPPAIPEGRTSRLTTLQLIEREVFSYTRQGERYVDCMAELSESEDLNEVEFNQAVSLHNRMVVELTATVTRFNRAVREFVAARAPESGSQQLNPPPVLSPQ